MSSGASFSSPSFLEGGSAAGALARSTAWEKTASGPIENWPQSLKTTVATVLHSRHPMVFWWGPELVQINNDGCPGHSSEFISQLPAVTPESVFRARVHLEPRSFSTHTHAPPRILIVDDNADAAVLLSEMMRSIGRQVVTAPDPLAALWLLEHFIPGFAVPDIGLPVMYGYELAGRVQDRLHSLSPGPQVDLGAAAPAVSRSSVGQDGAGSPLEPFWRREVLPNVKGSDECFSCTNLTG